MKRQEWIIQSNQSNKEMSNSTWALLLFLLWREWRIRCLSQTFEHADHLTWVVQVIRGFAWLLPHCAGKHSSLGSENIPRNCICNYFKHILVRSIITNTQHEFRLLPVLRHWCEDLLCNNALCSSLQKKSNDSYRLHIQALLKNRKKFLTKNRFEKISLHPTD